MKEKHTQLWIPLYVDKWLFGSTRIELEPDERGVFVDLMALAAKDNGYIRANETTPYLSTQLAGLLNITEKLFLSTIQKCKKYEKIIETGKGIYRVKNWDEYQLSDDYKYRIETGKRPIPGSPVRQNSDSCPKIPEKVGPIREDRIGKNKREEDTTDYGEDNDIPKDKVKETAEQYIVRQYKMSLGVPELDKDWDKKRFSYCVKFASGIIAAFDGDKKYACDWFDQQLPGWRTWAEKTGGKISIATIEARAWDEKGKYLEEKARRDKYQRQEGNYDSQSVAKTMGTDYTVGQVKSSGLTQIGAAITPNINKQGKP